jgi:hypothetical protein
MGRGELYQQRISYGLRGPEIAFAMERPGFRGGSFTLLPQLEWRLADCNAQAFQGVRVS